MVYYLCVSELERERVRETKRSSSKDNPLLNMTFIQYVCFTIIKTLLLLNRIVVLISLLMGEGN